MSRIATPSAVKIAANTSSESADSPPCRACSRAGAAPRDRPRLERRATRAESGRPDVPLDRDEALPIEVVDLRGPRARGSSRPGRAGGPAAARRRSRAARRAGAAARSAARLRASGASRTITLRVSPVGSTQSPEWSPAKATRSDCATCPTVTPRFPASPRSTRHLELRLLAPGREADVARRRARLAPIVAIGRRAWRACARRARVSSIWICL